MPEVAGVTPIDTKLAALISNAVAPIIVPWVAVMVLTPVRSPLARPLVLILATELLEEPQVTVDVKSVLLPSLITPVAVNCCVRPVATMVSGGAKEIEAKIGALLPPLVEGLLPLLEVEVPAPLLEVEVPAPLLEVEVPAPLLEVEVPAPLLGVEVPASLLGVEVSALLLEVEVSASLLAVEVPVAVLVFVEPLSPPSDEPHALKSPISPMRKAERKASVAKTFVCAARFDIRDNMRFNLVTSSRAIPCAADHGISIEEEFVT